MNLNLLQKLWAQGWIAYKKSLMESGHMLIVNCIHCFVAQGPTLIKVFESWVNNISIIKLMCCINCHN